MAKGISRLELQPIGQATVQLRRESMVGRSPPRHEAHDETLESGIKEIRKEKAAVAELGQQLILRESQGIECRLVGRVYESGQEMSWSYDVLEVETVLHIEVHSASTHIADFSSVV